MTRAIVRVALDTPLRRLFDYLPCAGELPQPGARVRVPFGRQRLIGVVHSLAGASEVPHEKLKPLHEVIDDAPVIDAGVMDLVEFAAQYYHHPVGEVMAATLPKLARTGAAARALSERWFASASGIEALDSAALNRAPRQRELLGILREEPGIPGELLARRLADWRTPMRALVARGFASSAQVPEDPVVADDPLLRTPGPALSDEQTVAVAAIDGAAEKFSPFLLHGITGSGKTEVYLHAVERCLRHERRALVLVPEIGLTPQLVARFRERFAVTVAVLHSGLTDAERLAAWRQCVSGAARVVLGTRSAVFAPIAALGMVIVDEEHDASFKQHESGFRYSARDLAILRAQRAAVPIVLGSATPSLETLQNVAVGKYQRLSLPRRAGQALPPRAAVLDLRTHAARSGIATPAVEAMQRHLGRRRPGAGVHQPARLFADAGLHGLWLDRALPRLRRTAHGASGGRAPALPSLRRRCAVARQVPAMRLRRAARRPGHRARRRDPRHSLSGDADCTPGPRRGAPARRSGISS